jgi:hypothetical protein
MSQVAGVTRMSAVTTNNFEKTDGKNSHYLAMLFRRSLFDVTHGIVKKVTKGIVRKVLVLAQISPFRSSRCKDHLVKARGKE